MAGHKISPGAAERMYDAMVLQGLNPAPWQLVVLQQFEQQSINEQFAEMVQAQG